MTTFLILYISFAAFTFLFFLTGYIGRGRKVVHAKWTDMSKGKFPIYVMYLSIAAVVVLWPIFWLFTFISRTLRIRKR